MRPQNFIHATLRSTMWYSIIACGVIKKKKTPLKDRLWSATNRSRHSLRVFWRLSSRPAHEPIWHQNKTMWHGVWKIYKIWSCVVLRGLCVLTMLSYLVWFRFFELCILGLKIISVLLLVYDTWQKNCERQSTRIGRSRLEKAKKIYDENFTRVKL